MCIIFPLDTKTHLLLFMLAILKNKKYSEVCQLLQRVKLGPVLVDKTFEWFWY